MGKLIKNSKMKIAKTFDMPREALFDIPRFTITANKEITVENHKGILSFKKEKIKLKTSIGDISIKGNDFEILFLGANTITLSGKFTSLDYERSDMENE
ncbi:sporulation protein YqfC [Hathewaya histolytica]|uniref:Sporulation protein YqfC n=1 Tax=Hathewaya histolytica TaxID=1498 RepID=A0A4U9RHF5_HATHI|nr:sporulation protein YqfC [Hathewaya histolytica]VTQ90611.1 sporulation protein YqfC [Hathewaya histolytica]